MFKKIWKKILKFINYGTNLKKHILVSFIIGFIGAIVILNLNLGQKPYWTLFFAINFFYFTILFEVYQLIKSNKPAKEYFIKSKITDTILDIIFTNTAFIIIFIPITLSIY